MLAPVAAAVLASALALAAPDGGGTPDGGSPDGGSWLGVDGRPMPAEWASGGRHQHVIVRCGAKLHWRLGETPRTSTDSPCCPEGDLHGRGPPFVARPLAVDGGFYLLETNGSEQRPLGACFETKRFSLNANRLEHYRLRLWVAASDLLPVVRRNVQLRQPDGSVLWLKRGQPVERVPDGGPRWQAVGGSLEVEVALAEDDVGLVYIPELFWGPGDSRSWGEAHQLGHLRQLRTNEATLGDAGIARFPSGEHVDTAQRAGRGFLVQRDSDCIIARAWVPARAMPRVPPPQDWEGVEGEVSSAPGCGLTVTHVAWHANAGARVYWPDGTRAGSLLADETLYTTATRSPSGHLCFSIRLDVAPNLLPLCFEKDEVEP